MLNRNKIVALLLTGAVVFQTASCAVLATQLLVQNVIGGLLSSVLADLVDQAISGTTP